MEILDLTPDFLRLEKEIITEEEYLNNFRPFFDHYFQYWSKRGSFDLTISEKVLLNTSIQIQKEIRASNELLSKDNLNSFDTRALIFVGKGTANGHAFQYGSTLYAWFAAETFRTEFLAKVFVLHEMIHALHYTCSPDLYFTDTITQRSLWRQLIVEGVATYLSQELLQISFEESLWADYLSESELKKWMKECQEHEKDLIEFTIREYDSDKDTSGMFSAQDKNDVLSNRSGYFLGSKMIRDIVEKNNLSYRELIEMPRREIQPLMLSMLKDRAKVSNTLLQ